MYFIAGYGRFQEVPVKSDFSAGSAPDDEIVGEIKPEISGVSKLGKRKCIHYAYKLSKLCIR